MIRDVSVSPWWAEGLMLQGELTFEDIVDRTVAMGVDGIDMQEIYLGLDPNPDPVRLRAMRRHVEQRGARISSAWFYADTLGAIGLSSVQVVAEHLRRTIAIGEALGSRYVVIQNGEPLPGTSDKLAIEHLLAVYAEIAPTAREAGITVAVEAARSFSRFNSPHGALEVVRRFDDPAITVAPDFEAWRRPTEGMPISYVENPGMTQPEPLDISVLRDCLPFSPFIHAKFLEFDASGTDPNYPVDELMTAVQESPLPHDVLVEYEGWLPEVHPDRDPEQEVRRGVRLVRSFAAPVITRGGKS